MYWWLNDLWLNCVIRLKWLGIILLTLWPFCQQISSFPLLKSGMGSAVTGTLEAMLKRFTLPPFFLLLFKISPSPFLFKDALKRYICAQLHIVVVRLEWTFSCDSVLFLCYFSPPLIFCYFFHAPVLFFLSHFMVLLICLF